MRPVVYVAKTTGVYLTQKPEAIASTAQLLRHFRAFIRSPYKRMRDPIAGWERYLDRQEAQHELRWLINIAINRKAGIPDETAQQAHYYMLLCRDRNRLVQWLNKRVRFYCFETDLMRRRYGHLVSSYDD